MVPTAWICPRLGLLQQIDDTVQQRETVRTTACLVALVRRNRGNPVVPKNFAGVPRAGATSTLTFNLKTYFDASPSYIYILQLSALMN